MTTADPTPRLNAALEGRYRIERELGAGGMATVYLAEDLRHGRKVALKVLKPELTAVVGAERFLAEIKTTANLQHPNILPLFDSGDAGGFLFYVMPYVEGETLRQRIDRERQMPVDDAIATATGVADALDYAHRRGVVHRDVKPANVLLQDGRPVIMDFGIALALGSANADRLTETGLSVGTPFYMSPEQVAGEETLDGRSDQYSLGCMLYEMLLGEPPFTGTTPQAVITKRFVQEPADVCTLRTAVPTAVGHAVAKALSRAPVDRFGSAAELALALRAKGADRVPAAPAKSVAVLPFANLGSDPDSEYFSDGMTEDIITHVSKVPGLKVISRTSVMRLKGSTKGLREIGRELGVGSILEGSVRRFGDRVRIVAQLIDAARDEHLWAETYDRDLVDVFAIQSDVAQKIAAALRAELTDSERDSLRKKPTHDIEAYQQVLKGRFFWAKRNEAGLRRAIECFEAALKTDPAYALAYAGIADCWNLLPWYGSVAPSDAFPKAKAAADKALALDDGLAEAHKSLAFALMLHDWDWAASDREFRRALELNSGDAPTHHWYFEYLVVVGRLDEAMDAIGRAYELDPLSLINNSAIGWGHYFRREYARAIDQLHRTLEMDANFIWARFILSKARLMTGAHDAVIRDAATSPLVAEGNPLLLATLGSAYALSGQNGEALGVIERLRAEGGYTSEYFVALIHLCMGDEKLAIDHLQAAFAHRDFWLVFLRSDPLWDPLRAHADFRDLLGRIGLGD